MIFLDDLICKHNVCVKCKIIMATSKLLHRSLIKDYVTLMLPAHFHDVTYGHIWSNILQELKISHYEIQEQSWRASYEQCRTKHEYYNASITLKNLSYFHDLLTAELRDYEDLIKFLNIAKT